MKASCALLLISLLAGSGARAQTPPTPGDDFDRFVNGAWSQSHPVPADQSWIGTWADLQAHAVVQSRELVEAAVADHAPMGTLYASFLDQSERDKQGIAALSPILEEIDAVHDSVSLTVALAHLSRIDVGAVFMPVIDEDDRQPGMPLLTVRQAKTGLPDPGDYTATDGPGRVRRDAYCRFLVTLLGALGATSPEAASRVDAVVAFEGRLATAQTTRAAQRDAMAAYHPMSLRELEQQVPDIAWRPWLEALDARTVQRLNVPFQNALAAQWAVVQATPLSVVRDHLRLKLLGAFSRYMDGSLSKARFAYYGTALRGTANETPSWRRGVDLVTNLMPEALGRAYASRFFSPAAKVQATAIADAVRRALDVGVAHADWLSASARNEIHAKLHRTRLSIGYPDRWPEVPKVELREDDLAGNVLRLNAWRFDRAVASLAHPVDRAAWTSLVNVPNAYASASASHVIFPAALLQPPMFDPRADPAENYARLGATIGHELSHLFDDQGRRYDADGRLRETWTSADVQQFAARTDALLRQMESYTPMPDERINGRLVLGEAVADLAGLQAAYDAFVHAAPASGDARRKADRHFFVAWGKLWRSNYHTAYLRTLLRTDAHPPGMIRVSTVRNLDAWYEAFGVPLTAQLYLAPEARVHMW